MNRARLDVGRMAIVVAVAGAGWLSYAVSRPQPDPDRTDQGAAAAVAVAPTVPKAPPERPPGPKLGLSINDPRASRGFTLLVPTTSSKTHLIDLEGRVVRTWEGDAPPALGATLLENGHLLRPSALTGDPHPLDGPGAGGRIQEFTWDGRLAWDFRLATDRLLPHHDVTRLPNGNVLVLAWEAKTSEEAFAAGRRALMDKGRLLPDCLLEIRPEGETGGEVVWEWHVWDHLIQDADPSRANYGDVAAHPERIDVNFGESPIPNMAARQAGMSTLRSLGYVGSAPAPRPPMSGHDWTHVNAVAYNPERDEIMLCVHAFSEVWIIDHGTTKAEAAGRSGGRRGKGGDLLYRWGNPRAHRAGTEADRRLYFPHDAHWIPPGLPGAGHVLVFNNGARRPGGPYSSVDEIVLPVDDRGRYPLEPGLPGGPKDPAWSYTAPDKIRFYAMLLSGAQRLPNGNTLICSGMSGTLFEVTPAGEVVWQYTCPAGGDSPSRGLGFGPPGGSALFRADRYAPGHPALAGRELTPGEPIEASRRGEPTGGG